MPAQPRLDPLPVDALLPEIVERLRDAPALILRSPTGSGKTTRVPPALEQAGLGPVVLLEPRRLAARAAARRMASERGERLGDRFGYRVRFDSKVSKRTRVTAVTEGLFLRRVLADPLLEGIGCVVFDEFHERHLDGDLALALTRRVQREVRSDLRIVVLSATIDPKRIAAFLDADVMTSEGRLFPVDVAHQPARSREPLEDQVLRGVRDVEERTPGDVLVFLPGMGEIRRAERKLGALQREGFALHILHGDLAPKEQDAALRRGAGRKIVLATNIAESSVTVDGVTGVIDSGLARVPRFDARCGLDRLELVRISMESVRQRAGRAGRQEPGVNLRLWSTLDERTFAPSVEPEVGRVDLAGAWLSLADFGEADPAHFDWLEAPPSLAGQRAAQLLEALGATRDGSITPAGRELARLPLAPRLGRLLLAGKEHNCLKRAALAAALIGERDPFGRALDHLDGGRVLDSDLLERIVLLEDIEAGRSTLQVSRSATRQVFAARDQLLRLLESQGQRDSGEDADFLRAVFVAFADRLARRRPASSKRASGAAKKRRGSGPKRAFTTRDDEQGAQVLGGRGVRLHRACRVREAELFVCVDLEAGEGEGTVRQASLVERDWLDADDMRQELRCEFDSERDAVRVRRAMTWRGLVVSESPASATDTGHREAVEHALADAARRNLGRAFDLTDEDYVQHLARYACFVEWTGRGTPGPVDPGAWVEAHLAELVAGKRSFKDLRATKLAVAWLARIEYRERVELDRAVPERMDLPRGRSARITYEVGSPPVLSARIQDLFGVDATPTVCNGRVPLLLHLCAPNGRPEQITSDLSGFWRGSYAQVRKDLRGRYPKHDWPEDPLNFVPRPRRRRT